MHDFLNQMEMIYCIANQELLFYNNHGKRSYFKTDTSKDISLIVVIQIPLKEQVNRGGVFGFGSLFGGKTQVNKGEITKVNGSLKPTCICGNLLKKTQAKDCYQDVNNKTNVEVSCDNCGMTCKNDDIMWHCDVENSKVHPNGISNIFMRFIEGIYVCKLIIIY